MAFTQTTRFFPKYFFHHSLPETTFTALSPHLHILHPLPSAVFKSYCRSIRPCPLKFFVKGQDWKSLFLLRICEKENASSVWSCSGKAPEALRNPDTESAASSVIGLWWSTSILWTHILCQSVLVPLVWLPTPLPGRTHFFQGKYRVCAFLNLYLACIKVKWRFLNESVQILGGPTTVLFLSLFSVLFPVCL